AILNLPPATGLPHASAGLNRHVFTVAIAAASSAASTPWITLTSVTLPSASTVTSRTSRPSMPAARASSVYSISVLAVGFGLPGGSVQPPESLVCAGGCSTCSGWSLGAAAGFGLIGGLPRPLVSVGSRAPPGSIPVSLLISRFVASGVTGAEGGGCVVVA